MNALPLRIDVALVVLCRVTIDRSIRRSIAVQGENVTIHRETNDTQAQDVIFSVTNFPVTLFPSGQEKAEGPI